MDFNDYQKQTDETNIYSEIIDKFVDDLQIPDSLKADSLKSLLGLAYVILGLAGEAGELANKMKKVIRDNNGKFLLSTLNDLGKENGDVTWYNARIFRHLGFDFSEGAQMNLNKLSARKEEGTLQGSGDNR